MKTKHALAISLLGFALAAPVLKAEEHKAETAAKEAKADPLLEGYADLSTALYKDDLAAAKKAAASMAQHHKDSPMAKSCQAIADSKTLEEARTQFKMCSDLAIPMAKEKKMMHEMHCPMAADGKGANWLQKSADEVQNPYMGSKMPHCGNVVK